MIQGASLFHLAKGFYRRGFFPTRVIFKGIWLQAYFRFVGRENPRAHRRGRSASLGFIEGHTVAEMEEIGDRGLRGVDRRADLAGHPGDRPDAPRRRPSGLAGHRRTGGDGRHHRRPAGLTGALGTTAEHVGRRLHRPAARRTAARSGQGRGGPRSGRRHGFDLARCFAYSDSFNDLPLLSLVGHPCAINPDPRLLAHAEEQDWQIRDYRTGRRAAEVGAAGRGAAPGATAGAVTAGLAIAGATQGLSLGVRSGRAIHEQHHAAASR